MNKINRLFQDNTDRKLHSLYFCAGAPTVDMVPQVLLTLQRRGIDMVEVGIPFSDPLADGPVIQAAGTVALRNGITLDKIFSQIDSIKDQVRIPLVLMGYLNVVMHYGYEAFFQRCVATGVSGCIIPDLPFDDYLNVVKPIADRYDVRVIMVSSAGITGAQQSFGDAKVDYFRRIDAMQLHNPRMIGFGISNRQTLESAQAYAAGTIIGSKFVTLLNETRDADKAIDKLNEALAQ